MVAIVSPAAAQTERLRIAVMDVGASANIDRDLVAMVTAAIGAELMRLGPFDAITMQDIDRSLELQGLKERLGCDDVEQCLAEIGGALGAEYLLSGRMLLQGDVYFLQLKLSHGARAETAGLAEREYRGGPKGLIEEVRAATRLVVRGLLAERSGRLQVDVSEEGATIRVDDSIVGVSPMPAFSLAGGVHIVSVEREGFVRDQRDVRIDTDQLTRERFILRPSFETWQKYRATATRWRYSAYGLMAGGGATLGGGIAAYLVGRDKTTRYHQRVKAYNESLTKSAAEYERLQQKQGELGRWDLLTVSCAVVGITALSGGLAIFFYGDDPARHDAVLSVEVGRVGLGVVPGGLTLTGDF